MAAQAGATPEDPFGEVALLARKSRAYGATVRGSLTRDVTHVLLDDAARLPSVSRRRQAVGTADSLVVVQLEWLRECLAGEEPWSSFRVCMRHMVGGAAPEASPV